MQDELLYQIGITLIPNVGPVNAKRLIAYCGSAQAVFCEKKEFLLKIPGVGDVVASSVKTQDVLKRSEEEITFINKHKIAPLYFLNDDYPERLKHCHDSPVMLYYRGNASLNHDKVLAIVGTRRFTPYGKDITQEIVKGLAECGVLIVSGMAFGIDITAHRAALSEGLPTVGVMGHGLHTIYPPAHRATAERMVTGNGGIITEFMSNSAFEKENFPMRNRIIAGLADCVLVSEARSGGGALITAEIANTYNRDVFAVPGRTIDECSKGCNYLIRSNKASLCEKAEDILYLMGWQAETAKPKAVQTSIPVDLNEDEQKIYDLLKQQESIPVDTLCFQSGISTGKAAAILLNLELKGHVKSLPGKVYQAI
ncbi:MAG: DNA-processing protein DprA [Bacteroidota bacterium]